MEVEAVAIEVVGGGLAGITSGTGNVYARLAPAEIEELGNVYARLVTAEIEEHEVAFGNVYARLASAEIAEHEVAFGNVYARPSEAEIEERVCAAAAAEALEAEPQVIGASSNERAAFTFPLPLAPLAGLLMGPEIRCRSLRG